MHLINQTLTVGKLHRSPSHQMSPNVIEMIIERINEFKNWVCCEFIVAYHHHNKPVAVY